MPSTCFKPARMFLEDDSNFACRSGCLEVRSPGSRPHQGGGAPHGAARRPGSSAMACTLRPAFAGNLELGRYEYGLPDEGGNK
jgi:hypothetical protein